MKRLGEDAVRPRDGDPNRHLTSVDVSRVPEAMSDAKKEA